MMFLNWENASIKFDAGKTVETFSWSEMDMGRNTFEQDVLRCMSQQAERYMVK